MADTDCKKRAMRELQTSDLRCQKCTRVSSANDQTMWNSAQRRMFKWLSQADVLEKDLFCKFCNAKFKDETFQFQKERRPLAHASLNRPDCTTPSRCRDCQCELKKGINVSSTQMNHKRSDDRRCNQCALQNKLANPCGTGAQVRRKLN